jgi:hypothetical protein
MGECYVFADEAGNFDFSHGRGATKYFVLATVMAQHCRVGDALLALRRDLGWRGLHLDRVFHATEDPQARACLSGASSSRGGRPGDRLPVGAPEVARPRLLSLDGRAFL